MAQVHWRNAVDGNFEDAAHWKPRRVPTYTTKHKDDAILDAAGKAYTVTLTGENGVQVESLQTAANATLSITSSSTLIVLGGTGAGVNAGTIAIGMSSALALDDVDSGVFDNTGRITIDPGAGSAGLDIISNVTLKGGGQVVLADSASSLIYSFFDSTTTGTLTNLDNTIAGAGAIGNGGFTNGGMLTVVNGKNGVIDATGAVNTLFINTPGAVLTNRGLLEATGAAGMTISNTVVDQGGGGTILAAKSSEVHLELATIEGGTLKTGGTGVIVASIQNTFDGSVSTLTNRGSVVLDDGSSLTALGAIANFGSIELRGSSSGSNIMLSNDLTLTGGGVIALGDYPANGIMAASAALTLTNVDNTITGDGELGAGQMGLVNQAGGTILETGSSGLVIDTGSAKLTNAGLIEAAGSGGLFIQGAVTNTGTIESNGPNTLAVESAITNRGVLFAKGGTLECYQAVIGTGSGKIGVGRLKFDDAFNQNVTFTTQTGLLELAQSQSYTATVSGIAIHGSGNVLELDDVAFTGAGEATYVDNGSHTGGVLTVSDGSHTAHITLAGNYQPSHFAVQSDGNGGVNVFYLENPPEAHAPAAPAARFAAAMAGLAGGGGWLTATSAEPWRGVHSALAAPQTHIA